MWNIAGYLGLVWTIFIGMLGKWKQINIPCGNEAVKESKPIKEILQSPS